ncbi:MAG: protein kinase [Pseudomonadota bacterium]
MRQCCSCQVTIPAQARFCTTCGTRQPDESAPEVRSSDDTDVDRPAAEEETLMRDPLIGRTIGRNYRIEQLLGVGGMGKVYRATQLSLEKTVALKLLHAQYNSDETTVHRFHREARAASRLEHPNIITILDFGQDADGTLFMAMELLRGRDLHAVLQRDGILDEARAARIVSQICAALNEAHQKGVIHRDLKLTNIVVEDRPERRDVVKLFDFGIAKVQRPGGQDTRILTSSGVVCGTPEYMSPEQIRGQQLDPRTDIYSLGVVLYQLTTAEFPFRADNPIDVAAKHVTTRPPSPRQFKPDMSTEMEALILRCLEKKPEKRFQSALELGQALAELASKQEEMGAAQPAVAVDPQAPRLEAVDDASARADTMPDPEPAPIALGRATETIDVVVDLSGVAPSTPVALPVEPPAPKLVDEARPVPPPVTLDGTLPATEASGAALAENDDDGPGSADTRTLARAIPDEPPSELRLPQPPQRVALLATSAVALLLVTSLATVLAWRAWRWDATVQQTAATDAALAVVVGSGADASVARDVDGRLTQAESQDAAVVAVAAASADAARHEPGPRSGDAGPAGQHTAVTSAQPTPTPVATRDPVAKDPVVETPRPAKFDKRRLFDLLTKGDIRHEAGDYEGALEFYQKALKLAHNEPRVHQKLALAYHNLGRFAESCTALGTFLRLEPHPPGEDYYRALIMRNCQ